MLFTSLFTFRVELATQSTPDTQPEATYSQVNKPSPSDRSQKKVTTTINLTIHPFIVLYYLMHLLDISVNTIGKLF